MDTLDHLHTFGWALVDGVLPVAECERLTGVLDELMAEQRGRGAAEITVNMPHLLRPEVFLEWISRPALLAIARRVLGDDCIANSISGFLSSPTGGRRVHIDSRIPVVGLEQTLGMIFMVALDDFTETNGATIVWPQSHRSGVDPRHIRESMTIPGGVSCTAPRGSMLVMLTHTWHDVGPNIDGTRRWGLGVQYCRWWQKPTYDFTRCGPEVFGMLDDEQKRLFGFTSRPPRCRDERLYTLTKVDDLPRDYASVMLEPLAAAGVDVGAGAAG